MAPVLPDSRRGFGPVTLLPLTMYIHDPSALNVTSCGSYAVGINPLTRCAPPPVSGTTAIALAPLLTAYNVPPSGEIVTADVAAPVYFRPARQHPGRPARVDRRHDPVARGVDDADPIGVVLRDVEPGLRLVERHAERVAFERNPLDQPPRRRRGHVNRHDFAIAIR